jgi:hypothetical protein
MHNKILDPKLTSFAGLNSNAFASNHETLKIYMMQLDRAK